MLVRPDERAPLARLLQFLVQGERLAHDCARAQAGLTTDPLTRRFLLAQAQQEAVHASVFQAAVAWLAPRGRDDSPALPALARYRELLEDANRTGRFYETILAEQVMLEGLGETILKRLEDGLVKRGAGFARLRRILLRQEEAHHGFGCRLLERAIADGAASPESLRLSVQEYLVLTDAIMAALGELFDSIHEDASAYAADAKRSLPDWLVQ